MKFTSSFTLLAAATVGLSACDKQPPAPPAPPAAPQPTFQAIAAKLTIGGKEVDSVIEWNTSTGDARLLNAASFADKSTGQQGNLIGWVPLGDLQQAVQNLASQIHAQQASKAVPSPSSTPITPKAN